MLHFFTLIHFKFSLALDARVSCYLFPVDQSSLPIPLPNIKGDRPLPRYPSARLAC